MDNTVNETWINKLVDELVDARAEVTELSIIEKQSNILLEIIFNNSRLAYGGEGMRIENEAAIFEYLKVIDPDGYYSKLKSLKAEREAETKRFAEEKAKSKGEIKEA